MDQDAALRHLANEARRYRRAQQALEEARVRTTDALVAALQAGARPTDVDRVSPFTPTYNRMKAREAGLAPRPRGGKRS